MTFALRAIHRAPHHGFRLGFVVILLVIAAVVIAVVRQRSRDRRQLTDTSVPTPGATATRLLNATTLSASIALDEAIPAGHYGFVDLVRSEWTKLRTVRSTAWSLLVTVVLGLGVSAIACAETRAHWASMFPGARRGFDAPSTSLVGIFIAQFVIGVLGVLAISNEYGSGTIHSTFTAAPNRLRVLAAKLAVFGVVAVVAAEVVSFASFFLGQALLTSPATHATLSSPGAFRAVLGCGLYVATLGIIAFGLATMMRHTAPALSAFVGLLLIAPLVVNALPSGLAIAVRRFLPEQIGAVLITTNGGFNGNSQFSPWVGLAILISYAVAANVIGAVMLSRRDA